MTSDVKDSSFLYTHWEEIPIIRELNEQEFDVISSASDTLNLRFVIMKVLADGIDDPDRDPDRKRHILSAAEIQQELDIRLEERITISNVYFHLQKLTGIDAVTIVGHLPTGRRSTAYYGRTARVFMLEEDRTLPIIEPIYPPETKSEQITDLFKLIHHLHPELSTKETEQLKIDLLRVNEHRITMERQYTDIFSDWIKTNESTIRDMDPGLIDLYFTFQQLINYQQDIVNVMSKIKELLGFGEYFQLDS